MEPEESGDMPGPMFYTEPAGKPIEDGSAEKEPVPKAETPKTETPGTGAKVEKIEVDGSQLERRVVAAIGTVPCHGLLYRGSGVLSKARDDVLDMLPRPVYPMKIIYNDGEVEVFCHYIWEKYCLVPPDKNINTLCAYFSSRKIHSKALK